jgi:hypothetical protein
MPERDAYVVVWSGRGPLPGQGDDDAGWRQREGPPVLRKGRNGELPSDSDLRRARKILPGDAWQAGTVFLRRRRT